MKPAQPHRLVLLVAVAVFVCFWALLLPGRLSLPRETLFSDDAGQYSRAAVSLVESGTYSVDGEPPSSIREPGYSALLALVYVAAGPENRLALFAAQAFLLLAALLAFTRELASASSPEVGAACALLLVLMPAVYHAVFSAYREAYTLSLLLIGAILLLLRARPSWPLAIAGGVTFGVLILTYYSFVFLPVFLVTFPSIVFIRNLCRSRA